MVLGIPAVDLRSKWRHLGRVDWVAGNRESLGETVCCIMFRGIGAPEA
jgi:hypothetical protein